MNSCEVRSNCKKNWDCDFCDNYSAYFPIDKKIKSPRQIAAKEKRKAEKKAKKHTDASKRGKANKRNGRIAEKSIEKLLQSWGLDVKRVPMSGALKAVGMVAGLEDKLAGDLRLTINDEVYRIESKRKVDSNSWYKMAAQGIIHIDGFCYLLEQDTAKLLLGGQLQCGADIVFEDKGFKTLHKFFDQDNAHIVIVSRPHHELLFFFTEETFYKLRGD